MLVYIIDYIDLFNFYGSIKFLQNILNKKYFDEKPLLASMIYVHIYNLYYCYEDTHYHKRNILIVLIADIFMVKSQFIILAIPER